MNPDLQYPYPLLTKLDDYVYTTEVNGKPAIIKIFEKMKPNGIYYETLLLRNFFYKSVGFPKLIATDGKTFMVLDLLGPNLDALLQDAGGTLPWDIVKNIGLQCLERLKTIHMKGFVYGDVKPTNFLLDFEDRNVVYIIDLQTIFKINYEERTKKGRLLGIPRFSSEYAGSGYTYKPWDDLKSLGFMMLYFMKGKLPWQGLKYNSAELFVKIQEIKSNMDAYSLSIGLDVPELYHYFLLLDKWKEEKHWILEESDYELLKFELYRY